MNNITYYSIIIGLYLSIWADVQGVRDDSGGRPPPTSPTNLQLRDNSVVQDRAGNNIQTYT